MACDGEQETKHHQGKEFGYGPVRNEEIVIAGFGEQDFANGKLLIKAFRGKVINKGDFSLARLMYTRKEDFEKNVVEPKKNYSPITSVGLANVGDLRKLMARLDWETPPRHIRSICVIDKVEKGDHDGHAALEYCEEQLSFTEGQRGRLRAHIAADLVRLFDTIVPLENAFED